MTDKDLLDIIEKGLLLLTDGNEIKYWSFQQNKWLIKKVAIDKRSGREYYQFKITVEGVVKRRTIGANRLIWMIYNKKISTQVIDHINGINSDNRPENLEEMSYTESHQQGAKKKEENILNSLCRWFEFVGEHHREPLTSNEVLYVETGF
tara:strand:- start:1236 stop:1685 length:450 start_codon:yes stop_codon:yes gene_type:complete